MKYSVKTILVACSFFLFLGGAFAQSGGKISVGAVSVNQDFLPEQGYITGWDLRIAARLGHRHLFFTPELIYQNTNVIPVDSRNPIYDSARIHTLKIPVGLGLKFKTTPFQKIFIKAGLIGNYVLAIDENSDYNFKQIKDVYGSYYGTLGYDFHWFTMDYRYEKSLGDNYSNIENSSLSSHTLSLGINF